MAQTKINKGAARIFTGIHGWLYKTSGGRFGGKMSGGGIIVLVTTGRTSGKTRERPLVGGDHPDGWVVLASFSGHDTHPGWYHNLTANPDAVVITGGDRVPVRARETEGEERARLWDQMAEVYPDYNEYKAVTDREIPVLVLERQ